MILWDFCPVPLTSDSDSCSLLFVHALLYPQSYYEWMDMKGLKHQIRLDKTVSKIPSNWFYGMNHACTHTHTHSADHPQCHSFRQHLSPAAVTSLGLVTQGTLKMQRHCLCDSDGLQHTRIIQWGVNYCLWITWWFDVYSKCLNNFREERNWHGQE